MTQNGAPRRDPRWLCSSRCSCRRRSFLLVMAASPARASESARSVSPGQEAVLSRRRARPRPHGQGHPQDLPGRRPEGTGLRGHRHDPGVARRGRRPSCSISTAIPITCRTSLTVKVCERTDPGSDRRDHAAPAAGREEAVPPPVHVGPGRWRIPAELGDAPLAGAQAEPHDRRHVRILARLRLRGGRPARRLPCVHGPRTRPVGNDRHRPRAWPSTRSPTGSSSCGKGSGASSGPRRQVADGLRIPARTAPPSRGPRGSSACTSRRGPSGPDRGTCADRTRPAIRRRPGGSWPS